MKYHFYKAATLPKRVPSLSFVAVDNGLGCNLFVSRQGKWVAVTGVVPTGDSAALVTAALAELDIDDMTETTTYITQALTTLGVVTAGDISTAMAAAGITDTLDPVYQQNVMDFIINNYITTDYMMSIINIALTAADTYTVDELTTALTTALSGYRTTTALLADVKTKTEAYITVNVENNQWIAERYVNSQVPLNKDPLRGSFTTAMENSNYKLDGVTIENDPALIQDKLPDNLKPYNGVTLAHVDQHRFNQGNPPVGSEVEAFFTMMGYINSTQFNPSFNIVSVTTGSAATLQADVYYPALFRSARYITLHPLLPVRYSMSPAGENSLTISVRVLSGQAKIKALLRDGARVNTDPTQATIPYTGHDTTILPEHGWTTITAVRDALIQESGVMLPAMTADSVMLIASPHVTDGRFVPAPGMQSFLLP